MRVTDRILKGAVFIGRELDGGGFKPLATGFIVTTNYMDYSPPLTFQYVVTCQHVIQGEDETKLRIRVNRKDGGAAPLKALRRWYFHPDPNRYVDVAVTPILLSPETYDFWPIPIDNFAYQEMLERRDVGIGEELAYPGLFVSQYGRRANMPVLRLGTLAALADKTDLVITASGAPTKVHLIESRSIGGHSGSPVFLNLMAPRGYIPEKPRPLPLHQIEYQTPYLLGMLRSHLNATDSGEYSATNSPGTNWVNSGIASVVPALDIADAINQEELKDMRKQDHKDHVAKSVDAPDKAASSAPPATDANPTHREDFTHLVGAAARKREQEG